MAILGVARVGSGRLGAFRLGYYQPWIKVYINGVNRTGGVVPNDARTLIKNGQIVQVLNHELDRARLRVFGFTPTIGQEVKVYLGDVSASAQLFGGNILNAEASAVSHNIFYDLDVVDYTWQLGSRRVTKRYTNQSATDILIDLMTFAPTGFTTTKVATGLATIDEITFTNDVLSDAISRVMERIGGYWFADYSKDLNAFTTALVSAPPVSDASLRGVRLPRVAVDLSQVATRILARGGGSATASDCAVGQTTMPIDDASWYNASGGTVQVGQQNVTYTGLETTVSGSYTGYVGAPPAVIAVGAAGGSLTLLAAYWVGATYITSDGETTGTLTQVTLTGAQQSIAWSAFGVPAESRVTLKRLYLSTANGSTSTLTAITDVALGTTSGTIPTTLAGAAMPTVNSAGYGTLSAIAGATSMDVEDLSQFPSSGWVDAGGQILRYTGRSASSGAGSLTGIPASGIGAITAQVRAGTVKSIPHLTGIAASGVGSIVNAIARGEQAFIFITRNDATAQTALAAYLGVGDGVREYFFNDGRLGEDELINRADALLLERKNPITTVRYETRDPTVTVGKTVAFSISYPPISGTFQIQQVTITEMAFDGAKMRVFPKRTVELTSKRFSFEDLVRQIRLVGRPN